jgi:hypothetical protein
VAAPHKLRLPIAKLARIKATVSSRLSAGPRRSAAVPWIRGNRRGVYFCGLPRLGKTNPRASAVNRSWLANLSASLRSGPGGIWRASSKASVARLSQASLSDVFLCSSLCRSPAALTCEVLSHSKTLMRLTLSVNHKTASQPGRRLRRFAPRILKQCCDCHWRRWRRREAGDPEFRDCGESLLVGRGMRSANRHGDTR